MATLADRAQVAVERMMHDAHVRYQRQQLAPERTGMPSTEVRGCHEQRATRVVQWKPEWFTHVRPNTIRAFIESQLDYARVTCR